MKKRRVDLQISVTFTGLPAGYRPSLDAVHEAIDYRVKHGKDASGVTTRIIGWTSAKGTAGYPSDDDSEQLAWKRFHGMIQASTIHVKVKQ